MKRELSQTACRLRANVIRYAVSDIRVKKAPRDALGSGGALVMNRSSSALHQHRINALFRLTNRRPIAATPNSASVPGSGVGTGVTDFYIQSPVVPEAMFVG